MARTLQELEQQFSPAGKSYMSRWGPRGKPKLMQVPISKKLCFVATDKLFLVELLYALSLDDKTFFVKYSREPRDGMYLGRCFVRDEATLGQLWRRYKSHDKVICTVQDDAWARQFRSR